MNLRLVILGVACALACVVSAGAQIDQAVLRGAVRDPLGVIPGAAVTLIDEGTGSERSAMTDEAGEYAFNRLQPGSYTVRVALPGFKTEERTYVRIAARQPALVDFVLEVTAVSHVIPEAS